MNTLKLSDLETVLLQNEGFVKTAFNDHEMAYVCVTIPGDKDLHFYFNYDSLIFKGEFAPGAAGWYAMAKLLCQFSFYFTEMQALQGRKEIEKVWRYYECWGGYQALEFALIELGMPSIDIQNWKQLLKK